VCIHRDAVMLIRIFCNFNSWKVKYMLYLNTQMISDKYLMGVCLYPIEVGHMGSSICSHHRCYRLLYYNCVSLIVVHHCCNYMLMNWNSGWLVRQPFLYILFIYLYKMWTIGQHGYQIFILTVFCEISISNNNIHIVLIAGSHYTVKLIMECYWVACCVWNWQYCDVTRFYGNHFMWKFCHL